MTYENDRNDMARELVAQRAENCIEKLKKPVAGVCPEHANISEGLALSLEMQVPMYRHCSKEVDTEQQAATLTFGKLKLTGKDVIEMTIRAALLLGIIWIIFGGQISKAADDPGLQIQPTADGGAVFMVDILALDTAKLKTMPWYKKPLGVASQIGANTAENVKDNPWAWITTGAAAALLSTGAGEKIVDDVSQLFGGGDSDKSEPKQPAQPAGQSLTITGNGNTVQSWYDVGPIRVDGQGNTIVLNNADAGVPQ